MAWFAQALTIRLWLSGEGRWRVLSAAAVGLAAANCGSQNGTEPAQAAEGGGAGQGALTTGTGGAGNTGDTGADTSTLGGLGGNLAGVGGAPNSTDGSTSAAAGAGGASTSVGASGGSGGEPSTTSVGGSGGGSTTGGSSVTGCGATVEGSGTPEICSFDIACALSSQIPTVGILDWSTDLEDLDQASIEFELSDPAANELNTGSGGPIDIAGATHRALLLGLKPERTYTFRIVAQSGTTICTSVDHTVTTGTSEDLPQVTRTVEDAAARARGFIVTSGGYPYDGAGPKMAYIIDSDGDVVWWAESQSQCSRALMDWEGNSLWMVDTVSASGGSSEMRQVAMDGTPLTSDMAGLAKAHHDITVLPGGILAALVWTGEQFGPSELVERLPDGTLETVARLDETVFTLGSGNEFHANALEYHAADDTYTVSDRYAGEIVKLTREGELLWQLGGECSGAPAPKCATASIWGNHGHHLLDTGNILIFRAGFMSDYPDVDEYSLTEQQDALVADLVWSYDAAPESIVLGDAQRLPNGNTLVVYSVAGEIHEVSPSGGLVQTLAAVSPYGDDTGSFGYANFRETLYGPPLR